MARNRAREVAFLGPAAFHHPLPLMPSYGSPLLRSNMGLQGCEAHMAHPYSGAIWGCRGVRFTWPTPAQEPCGAAEV